MPVRAYRRHQPEKTVLYQAVNGALDSLLTHCADNDRPLPAFVERELRGYLTCGVLEHGFARLRCDTCGLDRVLAFSCKGRGFCPSCLGRQMADTAAHLVDDVLPHVPYRQWVLTLPPPLRYLIAYDAALLADVLKAFTRAVFRFLRYTATRELGLRSLAQAEPGAVTAIQRAGSAVNLNVHFHTLATDGVFVRERAGAPPIFRALPAPSDAEVAQIAWDTCQRTVAKLRQRGLWLDVDPADDPLAAREPGLATLAAASLQGTLVLGPRAGQRLVRLRRAAASRPADHDDPATPVPQTPGYAFNLHAKRRVAARDRKALERLCRYLLRPPIANDRLSWTDEGRVAVRLTRPWSDGTSHIGLSPQELVAKLVPLVPPPRVNRVRYHGVFAPNAKLRPLIVPRPQTPPATPEPCAAHGPKPSRTARTPWAELLARTFAADVLACPRCNSRTQRIAIITRPGVIRPFLDSVAASTGPPTEAYAQQPAFAS